MSGGAIPYERIVEEDLNLGIGTVDVTMPAGGTAVGNKIGLHTFAGYYTVTDYGAVGDGVADDTLAFQAALDALTNPDSASAHGWALFIPPGRYRITNSLILTGRAAVTVFGLGIASAIINQAPAGKPTFNLDGKTYWTFDNFAILGDAGFPNDGIYAPNCGFGRFSQLFLCPNGDGIHLKDMNTAAIDNCQYWPSGYNAGATRTASLAKHAVLGDGVFCNDIHIRWLNCVGQTTIANGGSAICFRPTSNANNIAVYNCELEGTPPPSAHAAFALTNVLGFTLRDNFIENSTNTFIGCYNGNLTQLWMGATASLVFGDGTIGGRCGQILVETINANAVTIAPNSYYVTFTNCVLQSLTDNGAQTTFLNGSIAGLDTPDRLFPFGVRERGRTSEMGAWITPAFSGGIFSAATGTWVVEASDVLVWAYALVGKMMTVCFGFDSTSLIGGPSAYLEMTIPGGFSANMRTEVVTRVFNNSPSAAVPGVATVFGSYNQIRLSPIQSSGGTFLTGSNLISVFGQITFEIQ